MVRPKYENLNIYNFDWVLDLQVVVGLDHVILISELDICFVIWKK